MLKNISNLGDAAIYCDFGPEVNKDVNSEVIKYFKNLKHKKIKGITNLAPSYNKLIITFDLEIINYKELSEKIFNLKLQETNEIISKNIKIPICIDEEFALDIEVVSKKTNLNIKEIYKNIFNKDFYCYMTGFVAGMPFLGDTNKKIRLNRLDTPRVKVPKGSIGITEQFCNIYTYESPGGWNIIGNTPVKIFDESNEKNPLLINPGDSVQFYEINKNEFNKVIV
tara:strand:- start:462 stop:1136 length:675 start_codon:yes stop_codon:yes gene_type:complete